MRNPIALLPALILAVAGAYGILHAQQPTEAKERADSQGRTPRSRPGRHCSKTASGAGKGQGGADKFAAQRNQAMQELWEMTGQLKAMKRLRRRSSNGARCATSFVNSKTNE